MLVLDLNETTDQLSVANSVCWHDQMLRLEDTCLEKCIGL